MSNEEEKVRLFCVLGIALAVFVIMVETFNPGITTNMLLEFLKRVKGI